MPAAVYSHYAGGMNAGADNPRLMQEGQVRLLVNGTVRRGWADPRPSFQAQEMRWLDVRAQRLWEDGMFQGAGVLTTPEGDYLFFAFDGRVLRVKVDTMACGQAFPQGANYEQPLFHPRRRFVFFQQRAGWMIAQDGTSLPLLCNDSAAIYKRPKSGSMRTGTLMADGWGRLAVADHGRRRIRFSDHELDPNSDPLSFTEGSYFKNAQYLEVPATLGRIMDMQYAPSLNGNDDKGPLLVFCERGVVAYNVGLPRDQWLSQDISATLLPKLGTCAHRAAVARGNDVIFSDHEGRVQSLASAISRQQDARIDRIDTPVWGLYQHEDAMAREHRCAAEFDGRVLVSVQPERLPMHDGRQRIRHRGMVVLQGDAAIDVDPVWDGLWTGIYPVAMLKAMKGGRQACFILSLDSDGKHRLYELATSSGYDLAPEPKAAPMLVQLRAADMELPFRTKPWDGAVIRLGDIKGKVQVRGWWSKDRGAPKDWFKHSISSPACALFGAEGVQFPRPTEISRINLPRPQEDQFFEATMSFEVTGQASLKEAALETKDPKTDPNVPSLAQCETQAMPGNYSCDLNPFAYDLQAAQAIR